MTKSIVTGQITVYRFLPVYIMLFYFLIISCEQSQTATDNVQKENPFEVYVNNIHPSFSYELVDSTAGEGFTTYIFRMVSQEWLNEELVNEPEWWHWVTIVVPDEINHSTALLWIGGGSSDRDQPDSADSLLATAALETQSVTIDLHNVPFQPLTFYGDSLDQRYEDDLIAYGWREFMESGANDEDALWLARLPMTAAAMRTMDLVSEFSTTNLGVTIDNFVVSGASKRGWTTWTTAIFDDRVVAIAPAVIDLLNMVPSFEHHWQAYGEWSPAIQEYEDENIMDWQYSTEYKRLTELVDPYSYIDRLNLPKYIINAASDEFFLPDSWQFYWYDLPGEKYIRYIPNTGHSLSETDATHSLISFYYKIINDDPIPEFNWVVNNNSILIETDPDNQPLDSKLWTAHNNAGRDFRFYVIDKTWESQDLSISSGEGILQVDLEIPEQGYSAYFVEATYPGAGELTFKLTSGVVVLPDTYPYPPFETNNPLGTPLEGL